MNDYTFKEACILFCAIKIIHNGRSYSVPEGWRALYATPKVLDSFKPHVPFLTAEKQGELWQ